MQILLTQEEHNNLISIDEYHTKVQALEYAKQMILSANNTTCEENIGDCGSCPIGGIDDNRGFERQICTTPKQYHK